MSSTFHTPTVGRTPVKAILISATVIVAVGFGLLAAWNTRQVQHRMQCAANFERIAAGHRHYREQHGVFPPKLKDLEQVGLRAVELICPATRKPYLYHCSESANIRPDTVLVSEPVTNHGKGAHLLFGDYRFQFVPREHLNRHLPGASGAMDSGVVGDSR